MGAGVWRGLAGVGALRPPLSLLTSCSATMNGHSFPIIGCVLMHISFALASLMMGIAVQPNGAIDLHR